MEPNDRQLSNSKKAPKNIGIVTTPGLTTGAIPLSRLIEVLQSLSRQLYVISSKNAVNSLEQKSENVHIVEVKSPERKSNSLFSRTKHNAGLQFGVASKVVRLAGNVGIFVFLFAEGLVLPMLTAKLLGKKTLLMFTGSGANLKADQVTRDPLTRASTLLQNINRMLADKIMVFSKSVILEHGMSKYRHKIAVGHATFYDSTTFNIQKPLNVRGNLIGYIGRLHEIKGVLNFVEAIPTILQERSEMSFLIGGNGPLRQKLEAAICQAGLGNNVTFTDWIPHDELPNYLNRLKLLIIPSYTETGPYIAFEAMACGTPVLATPVGSIPDMIKDCETGFIMENNSPECISRNVIRALNHPDPEQVAKSARALIERELAYETVVESFRKILTDLWKPLHIHTGDPHKLNRGVNNDGEQNKG